MAAKWVDLQEVKEAVSLEAVLRWYQVEALHRSGRRGQLRGRCPLHGEGGEDAFHASLSKNAYHCFYCQAHGNVLDFVAGMEHCSVREAALQLQDWLDSGQLRVTGRRERELVPKEEGLNRRWPSACEVWMRRIPIWHTEGLSGGPPTALVSAFILVKG